MLLTLFGAENAGPRAPPERPVAPRPFEDSRHVRHGRWWCCLVAWRRPRLWSATVEEFGGDGRRRRAAGADIVVVLDDNNMHAQRVVAGVGMA